MLGSNDVALRFYLSFTMFFYLLSGDQCHSLRTRVPPLFFWTSSEDKLFQLFWLLSRGDGWVNLSVRARTMGRPGWGYFFLYIASLGFGLPEEEKLVHVSLRAGVGSNGWGTVWLQDGLLVAPCSSLPFPIPYSHCWALLLPRNWCCSLLRLYAAHCSYHDPWALFTGHARTKCWLGTHITLTMEYAQCSQKLLGEIRLNSIIVFPFAFAVWFVNS